METGRPKKTYKFISPLGEVVEITGLKDFCKDKRLSMSHMSAVHCGKEKSHKGWYAYEVVDSSPYGNQLMKMTPIPNDAYRIAKDGAKKHNLSIEEYIADIIEYVAGGYIDSHLNAE